jgi:hypothetical protein
VKSAGKQVRYVYTLSAGIDVNNECSELHMASVCCCFEPRLMVFENRVLGKIFGSKRVEKLHNELHGFQASLNIIGAIKLGRMRWADYSA